MGIVLEKVDEFEDMIVVLESDTGKHDETSARAKSATCEGKVL